MTRRNVTKAHGELAVFGKCRDLIEYTLKITNNTKRFPKKMRFTLTNRIQDCAIELYKCLLYANEIYPKSKEEQIERTNLQRKALTHCKELLFYIDLSLKQDYITFKTVEYWSKLVTDVKFMTAKWMKVDKQRF